MGPEELAHWLALDEIEAAWKAGEDPREGLDEELSEDEIAEQVMNVFGGMVAAGEGS